MTVLARLTQDQQPGSPLIPQNSTPFLILTTARALMAHTLAPRDVYMNARWIKAGQEFRYDRLVKLLSDIGYTHESLVTEPGQFSRRGGIIDLWPPSERTPLRLDFFGDEIESIRQFDPQSQRSTEPYQAIRITPAREGLPKLYNAEWDDWLPQPVSDLLPERHHYYEFFLPWMNPQPTCLLDFLPSGAIVLLDDLPAIETAVMDVEEHAHGYRAEQIATESIPDQLPLPYLTWSALKDQLTSYRTVQYGHHR